MRDDSTEDGPIGEVESEMSGIVSRVDAWATAASGEYGLPKGKAKSVVFPPAYLVGGGR